MPSDDSSAKLVIKRLRFPMKVAFPQEDVTARWALMLGAILNDLAYTNTLLMEALEEDPSPTAPRWMFHVGLTCSYLREGLRFLEKTKKEEAIEAFISGLPPHTKAALGRLCQKWEPWENSWVKTQLVPIRNKYFHYLRPTGADGEVLSTAMTDCAEMWADVVVSVRPGPVPEYDHRYRFADLIMARLTFGPHNTADEQKRIESFLSDLTQTVSEFLDFGYEAMTAYMSRFRPQQDTFTR